MRGLTMRQPSVVSSSFGSRANARSGLAITYGARDMLSTPPASTSSASPHSAARERALDRLARARQCRQDLLQRVLAHAVAPGHADVQASDNTAVRRTDRNRDRAQAEFELLRDDRIAIAPHAGDFVAPGGGLA